MIRQASALSVLERLGLRDREGYVQADRGTSTSRQDLEQGVGGTADDRRLVDELLRGEGNLDRSVTLFRRHRLSCEAEARVPECIALPRFVSCTNWDHRFPGEDRDAKVRWVFDRRLWSVVVSHVRRAAGAWSVAGPDEVLDVTESLALANERALYDLDDWGCTEGLTFPGWAAEAAVDERVADAVTSQGAVA